MSLKRTLILGGAALLVAACSSSPTSIKEVDGGAASNARGAVTKKKGPQQPGQAFSTAADSAGCNWVSIPVLVGFAPDSACVGQQ